MGREMVADIHLGCIIVLEACRKKSMLICMACYCLARVGAIEATGRGLRLPLRISATRPEAAGHKVGAGPT
jgi:hypothetical protein